VVNKEIHGFRGIGLFLVVHRFDAEAAAKEEPRFLGTIAWKGAKHTTTQQYELSSHIALSPEGQQRFTGKPM